MTISKNVSFCGITLLLLVPLMIHLLPVAAHAQAGDCNQITNLYAIADWRTLTTGPFDEKDRNGTKTAPAKNLLTGFDRCYVAVNESSELKTVRLSYVCDAPPSSARGNDDMAATKSVAARWQSCFAGGSESSKITGPVFGVTIASVSFKKGDMDAFFSRLSDKGKSTEPVKIEFSKTLRN